MTRTLALCLLSTSLLTGCITLDPVKDSTRYYLLSSPDNALNDAQDALRVGLHPLSLPPYLDHREIVVQRGNSEIVYEDGHRWADGLASALQRSLIQHLEAQSNVSEVMPAPWTSAQFDRELSVEVKQCQGDENGQVRLTASWEVDPGDNRNRATFQGSYPPGDIPALVEELGTLVGQLAEAIHADL